MSVFQVYTNVYLEVYNCVRPFFYAISFSPATLYSTEGKYVIIFETLYDSTYLQVYTRVYPLQYYFLHRYSLISIVVHILLCGYQTTMGSEWQKHNVAAHELDLTDASPCCGRTMGK